MDPHQASHQLQRILTGTHLSFNPAPNFPKFLCVTFDRTLSFDLHIHSLDSKFFFFQSTPIHSLCIVGSSKESLSQLYKALLWPVLSYPIRGGSPSSAIQWKVSPPLLSRCCSWNRPWKKLILCPPHFPLDPPNFTVTTFSEGCSRSDPGRPVTAADFFRRLPASDVDWLCPSPLGARGAGFHAACRICLSPSPISFSFSGEFLALIHGLEWCHSHLKTCHFPLPFF